MEKTVRFYSLMYNEWRTYVMASLFVIGNVLLPQLVHTLSMGGIIWLPIYFFTLIGAYKYGWRVGLLTAMLSPLVNAACFGMPAVAALPAILCKSVLLALAAAYAVKRIGGVSLWSLVLVVMFYQSVGTLAEWVMVGDFWSAVQDFRLGVPGMLVQVFGGFFFIRYLLRK